MPSGGNAVRMAARTSACRRRSGGRVDRAASRAAAISGCWCAGLGVARRSARSHRMASASPSRATSGTTSRVKAVGSMSMRMSEPPKDGRPLQKSVSASSQPATITASAREMNSIMAGWSVDEPRLSGWSWGSTPLAAPVIRTAAPRPSASWRTAAGQSRAPPPMMRAGRSATAIRSAAWTKAASQAEGRPMAGRALVENSMRGLPARPAGFRYGRGAGGPIGTRRRLGP